MSKPTPGPTYVYLPRGCDSGCRTIRTEEGRTQGTYYGTEICTTDGLGDDETDRANAELISAAFNAASECERLGFDGRRAIEMLPKILQTLHKIEVITGDLHEGLASTVDACNRLASAWVVE